MAEEKVGLADKQIPKIIWTYWHQGFENAPYVVKSCINRLKQLHPMWEVMMLHAGNINEFTSPFDVPAGTVKRMTLQHRSDLLRTQLLNKYGGVWIDPTVFCVQPFDSWLTSKASGGLFLFTHPGRDRIIANWFIAAQKQHPLLIAMYDELCRYWSNNEFKNLGRRSKSTIELILSKILNRNLQWPIFWFSPFITRRLKLFPYMVYHYKFFELVRKGEYHDIYLNMNKWLPANAPHKLQEIGLLKKVSKSDKQIIDEEDIPLHKLAWNLNKNGSIADDTVLRYLFNKYYID